MRKKNDKWRFSLADSGAELDLEESLALAHEFQQEGTPAEDLSKWLPKQPLKVGESWTVDVQSLLKQKDDLAQLFGLDVANAKSSAKLQRVYKQDGRLFGVLEQSLEMPIGSFFNQKADAGSRMTIKMTADACIDGTSSTMTVVFEISQAIVIPSLDPIVKNGKTTILSTMKGQATHTDMSK